jgi:uncharacterized protein
LFFIADDRIMKYLLVFGVVLFAIWLWRHNREVEAREQARTRPKAPAPRAPTPVADMVACAHCGLHLPQHEAIVGQHGLYCCEAHRRQRET